MSRARASLAGILASGLALGVTELATGLLPGGRSVFVAVADAVIGLTPGPVVRLTIEVFGKHDRLVLTIAMAVTLAGLAGLVGVAANRRRWLGVVGVLGITALGAAAAVTDPLVPTVTAAVAPALGAAAGVVVLELLLRAGGATPEPSAVASPLAPPRSRRAFVGLAVSTVGAAVVAAAVGRSLRGRAAGEAAREAVRLPQPRQPLPPPAAATMVDVPGVSPLITPNRDFYRIDTAFTVPRIDPSTHRVRITGMVDTPLELGYAELVDLADTEADVMLSCVSNEVGGGLVGTARWLGIPLGDLLDRAGVRDGATQIVGRAVDGWTSGFPVEAAFDGRPALVAVGMNGEPLPAEHGFPVRLVISGLYGYVSDTKWLSEIELTTFEAHDAYWIPRGWSERGPIKTQSRIDVPRHGSTVAAGTVAIAGVAWSDEHGVTRVQVSIDGGPWRQAELADALSSTSWRQWHLPWDAAAGEHVLAVRAFDADGIPQTAEVSPPAPDGATGHHTIRVTVT